jgi:TusA-related sulfurtransferase
MTDKKTIDARGLFCPGPLQVLKGVIKKLDNGEYLELLADDSDSKKDIREWCEAEGHELESIIEDDEGIAFLIKK